MIMIKKRKKEDNKHEHEHTKHTDKKHLTQWKDKRKQLQAWTEGNTESEITA